jgi:hypothetical protein
MTSKTPNGNQGEQKSKFAETIDSIKKDQKIESLVTYAKNNTQDTVAYVLLLLGIVWIFINSFYGGILVGLVAGFYYGTDIIAHVKNANQTINEMGIPRALVLGLTLVAFFILAPGIFIGAAISAGIKQVVKG